MKKQKKKIKKKRWIAIDITVQRGTEFQSSGKGIVMQKIPIDKKYHCELCKKKPHIYVVDSREDRALLFCDWPHLFEYDDSKEVKKCLKKKKIKKI